jgi:nucleotide-binding universal stress UspA family protein
MKLLEKILVPVNFERKFDSQLDMALNVAEKFNSELILLHVLPLEAKTNSVKELINKAVNKEFEELLLKTKSNKVKTTPMLKFGNVFDQIINVSEDENVNVIIIGNETPRQGQEFGIGVLAEKLTRKSQKPVWVHRTDASTSPKEILCPVDFSEASARALNNALKIARIFDSRLNIINVYEPLENLYSPRFEIDPTDENQKREAENKRMFKHFLDKFNFSGVNYHSELLKGDAYLKISEYIKTKKIDLLLIGATGKTMLSRILLGSLTEQIARDLPCSMISTKAENILNLKIDNDISNIEKHLANAKHLEENGYFNEAIEQLKICLQINDLHIPSLTNLIRLYKKMGENEQAENYTHKLDEIFKRLWDKKVEFEIRRHYKL